MTATSVARIFVSYRRDDSAGHAGRICAWLKQRLGDESVFMDVEGIEPGEDYVAAVQRRIASASLVLVVIGSRWASVTDGRGRRRLNVADDLVRLEIAAAIKSGVRVVPVLVSGATMPTASELPRSIAGLARLNALESAEDLRRRIAEAHGPVPCVLAVNKVDLHGEWQVGMEELEALARAGRATFTTSAKTGRAVDDLFVHLARAILARPKSS